MWLAHIFAANQSVMLSSCQSFRGVLWCFSEQGCFFCLCSYGLQCNGRQFSCPVIIFEL